MSMCVLAHMATVYATSEGILNAGSTNSRNVNTRDCSKTLVLGSATTLATSACAPTMVVRWKSVPILDSSEATRSTYGTFKLLCHVPTCMHGHSTSHERPVVAVAVTRARCHSSFVGWLLLMRVFVAVQCMMPWCYTALLSWMLTSAGFHVV